MEVGSAAASPAVLLGVIVLLDVPGDTGAQSRVFIGSLTPDQRSRAAEEIMRIAETVGRGEAKVASEAGTGTA